MCFGFYANLVDIFVRIYAEWFSYERYLYVTTNLLYLHYDALL